MKYFFVTAIFTGLTLVSQLATASNSTCLCSQIKNTITDDNQVISLNSDDAEAYFDRGFSHLEQGDYQSAISDFNELIRLIPNLEEAYFYRGLSYYKQKNYQSAITDYDQAIRLNPNFAEAYFARGVSYDNQGD